MKKISIIFGTRPEAIKLAPLILALKQDSRFQCDVCVTAQHREMLDQILEAFDIVPDTDLDLMQPNQTLAGLSARTIEELDRYIKEKHPDLILIQGDTTTVFCAALAAFYNHIPVGHVEAGLRTRNLESPWPEEGNRILTSQLATLHFAPTETNRQNLLREGVLPDRIFVTGNTVIDALFLALEKVETNPPFIPGLPAEVLKDWDGVPLVLITGHRRESFGSGLESICQAIAELAQRFPKIQFIYPVHLNPNVLEPVWRILGAAETKNIHLINPLPYLPFIFLMNHATLILTDSGGIQEEAASLGKPVLVMRSMTERPEAIAAGTAKLVGTDYKKIVAEASGLLTDKTRYNSMVRAYNPYGDGQATGRIIRACQEFLERCSHKA
jgi:UDP-N-acetylglucosamine 2-epimerase (non-hydrolysing)